MKIKSIFKIIIDIVMVILFTLLMNYYYMDSQLHEWLGISLFIVFVIHTILNYKWYKNLFKGKYNIIRILSTIINISLLIVMILLFISSMFVSLYVFKDINFNQAYLGRNLHLILTMWSYILVALHLGLHIQMFIVMIKKHIKINNQNILRILKWILRIVLLIIVIYGTYNMIDRKIWEELFLLTEFKFYDYDKALFLSIIETISIFILFTSISYYLKKSIIYLKYKKK